MQAYVNTYRCSLGLSTEEAWKLTTPSSNEHSKHQVSAGNAELHKKEHQFISGVWWAKYTVSLELLAVLTKHSKNERMCQKK